MGKIVNIDRKIFDNLVKNGLNNREIQDKLGVSKTALYHFRKRNGLIIKEDKIYDNKEWLEDQYVNQNKTGAQIAREIGVDISVICRKINMFEIRNKSDLYDEILTEENINYLYIDCEMSIKAIEKKLEIPYKVIKRKIDGYNIRQRNYTEYTNTSEFKNLDLRRKTKHINKDMLFKMYVDEKLSSTTISEILNLSKAAVVKMLNKYKIPIRDVEQLRKISSAKAQGINIDEWERFVVTEDQRLRKKESHRKIIRDVLKGDDYTCQCCNKRGGRLAAHHILNFKQYPEYRETFDNLITLCEDCHSPTIKGSYHHTFGVSNNCKRELDEYVDNLNFYTGKSDWETFEESVKQ